MMHAWTTDAAAVVLSGHLFRAVRVCEGETDPPPFATLDTHEQAVWIAAATGVLVALTNRMPVKDTALLNEAAADLRQRLTVLRGGKA